MLKTLKTVRISKIPKSHQNLEKKDPLFFLSAEGYFFKVLGRFFKSPLSKKGVKLLQFFVDK